MPQTFQVLRCYKCEVFQVHPTKKANKWKCKLCNEKQSTKRFYGLGTGKECRLHVQKLNGIRGDIDARSYEYESDASSPSHITEGPESEPNEITHCSVAKKSKWLDYVDNQENSFTDENEITMLNNTEVVLELPKKLPRKSYKMTRVQSKFETETLKPSTLSNDYKMSNEITSEDKAKSFINTDTADTFHGVPKPPKITNSKWAKFVEYPLTQNSEDEHKEIPITDNNSLLSVKSLNSMFPLLEDEELDSVLDL
ncbi:MRN complex-interacting protein [Leguminivora glycinivorella]|uniref:MRN complex-interacting protein n=1 Tax=Leguminivora glycinivorella TaxID=1035111 RepID=UPI0020106EA2|nr:MRN complex-interacting protein [Leguminivora glycinivorella]